MAKDKKDEQTTDGTTSENLTDRERNQQTAEDTSAENSGAGSNEE